MASTFNSNRYMQDYELRRNFHVSPDEKTGLPCLRNSGNMETCDRAWAWDARPDAHNKINTDMTQRDGRIAKRPIRAGR
jgi:hypothetical protein